jgi:hypothetical protein
VRAQAVLDAVEDDLDERLLRGAPLDLGTAEDERAHERRGRCDDHERESPPELHGAASVRR